MNNPIDALLLIDATEMVEDDWDEFKTYMIKLKLKWKWIGQYDWRDK